MRKLSLAGCLLLGATFSSVTLADELYKVTITNITRGVSFTPILAITHTQGSPLFTLGAAASQELADIAEGGATGGFSAMLMDSGMAKDAASSEGLLGPGQSTTIMVSGGDKYDSITVTSMLLPTNDAFFAVNGMALPEDDDTLTFYSPAYDAGSENNDELCANIPGPYCKGAPFSEGQGEGFVHIHAGIKGIADLSAADYDWRNPVAKISISRVELD